MGQNSKIEWTDATWSPLRVRVRANAAEIARVKGYTSLVQIAERMTGHVGHHCEHVSTECINCYAETRQHRCLPADGTGLPYDRRSRDLVQPFVDEKVLRKALSWREPAKVFVENQSDIFGDWFTDEMIERVFAMMAITRKQTYQVLSKRDERMFSFLTARMERMRRERANECPSLHSAWPDFLSNVWLGVSVGTREALPRIDTLRLTPAALRFLSIEPLLEDLGAPDLTGIDWVIAGGESGPGARPAHPDWFRSIRDQCVAAGVPFFFKQWGEWLPGMQDGAVIEGQSQIINCSDVPERIGKKKAGALLDACEWKQFPGSECQQ